MGYVELNGSPVDLALRRRGHAPRYLVSCNLIEHGASGVRLLRPLDNLGPTLEWYVAELCERELAGSAAWSVQLPGLPAGGDFDVLAWLDPTLLYVETKSAAPSEVTESEPRNFLQRCEDLAPDLAVRKTVAVQE